MPILTFKENGKTIYVGVRHANEASAHIARRAHGVIEHESREAVELGLLDDYARWQEEHAKDAALLRHLMEVSDEIGQDTTVGKAIWELAAEVETDALHLAESSPATGLLADVEFDDCQPYYLKDGLRWRPGEDHEVRSMLWKRFREIAEASSTQAP